MQEKQDLLFLITGPFVLITRLLSRGSFGNKTRLQYESKRDQSLCPSHLLTFKLPSFSFYPLLQLFSCISFRCTETMYKKEESSVVSFFFAKRMPMLSFLFLPAATISKNIVIQGQ